MPEILLHNLITIPNGKKPDDIVQERHDIVLLFDATKSNPNGDPDLENMPRRQPDTLKGLVTDVCLKRKIRNFFSLYSPDAQPINEETKQVNGYDIFIRENAILQKTMESPEVEKEAKDIFVNQLGQKLESWNAKKKTKKKKKGQEDAIPETDNTEKEESEPADEFKKRAFRDALCKMFFDVRAFGGVVSTEGPLKGSFFGQIRGPIQFSFSESLDKVLQLDATITRCCVASEKELKEGKEESEEKGNRTMGRQYRVDYGLYRTHIFFSPAFAAKTKFTYYDLDNFFFALKNMFRDDVAGPRTGMCVVGLIDFQHSSCLGNEHAHKLFKLVDVHRKEEKHDNAEVKEFPNSINDYCGDFPRNNVLPSNENIQVRRHVWEIPECKKEETTTQ